MSAHSEIEAKEKAAKKLGVNVDEIIADQDPDVLDTWFSSALLPFSSFGWPDQVCILHSVLHISLKKKNHCFMNLEVENERI